ncbi:non-heme iron oxygenase ferredoxin subunit [Candidatus Peregrinibacteria bacterium]|nr:non-heme iron oxygenase ferredoxin subunit [Candidatus Peregrinibacteria bacterium]
MNKYLVGKIDDFAEGSKKRFVAGEIALMIAKVEGSFFAVLDTCTHKQASLSAGELQGFSIECPWHGAKFDLRTGEVKALPAAMPLKTFKTEIIGQELWVMV